MAYATLVPMRFGIVFRSEAAVRDFLARHEDALVDARARLEGKQEWSVKLYVRRAVLADWMAAREPVVQGEEGEAQGDGRAYFARRAHERVLEEEIQQFQHAVTTGLHDRLSALSDAVTLLTLQRHGEEELVLHAAYLLGPDAHEPFERAFQDVLDTHARLGFAGERTGPWPPYNFVSLRLDV
jgi:hypothetical protein